ncbi:MAG: polyphosphate polymerase domain-containing protein [Bacteroidia bacterium]
MFTSQLEKYETIGLEQLKEAELQRRIDTKFLLRREQVLELLDFAIEDYRILEVEGVMDSRYDSIYFDTSDEQFYHDHHRKKLTRHKVRKRCYVNTNTSFFEIKHKNNKGITNKQRLQTYNFTAGLNANELDFLNGYFEKEMNLKHTLSNSFSRITLVSKKLNERVTIDHDLRYNENIRIGEYGQELMIVETKKLNNYQASAIETKMRYIGIKPYKISKYCMGMAQIHDNIKQNRFKTKFRKISKLYK